AGASVGFIHAAACDTGGTVFTWGSSVDGKLGHGLPLRDFPKPTLVSSISNLKIVKVSCGRQHTLALSDVGRVLAWGCNDDGQW
ncbi:unnamed protein product, partial [Discosporangium mesarthrocarpum]